MSTGQRRQPGSHHGTSIQGASGVRAAQGTHFHCRDSYDLLLFSKCPFLKQGPEGRRVLSRRSLGVAENGGRSSREHLEHLGGKECAGPWC